MCPQLHITQLVHGWGWTSPDLHLELLTLHCVLPPWFTPSPSFEGMEGVSRFLVHAELTHS